MRHLLLLGFLCVCAAASPVQAFQNNSNMSMFVVDAQGESKVAACNIAKNRSKVEMTLKRRDLSRYGSCTCKAASNGKTLCSLTVWYVNRTEVGTERSPNGDERKL